MAFDLQDYDGPLGALEPGLARRRIAVVADRNGRVCLVRPDSVLLRLRDDAPDALRADLGQVRRPLESAGLQLLGQRPPDGRYVAARRRTNRAPDRWRTGDLERVLPGDLAEVLPGDVAAAFDARPHLVYLADGVDRHFRIVDDGGSSGTPSFASPTALRSTARPAAAPPALPMPLAIPGRRRPHVLVLDTGLRTMDAHTRPEHPWLVGSIALPPPALWRDLTTVGRWDDEDEPDDDRGGRLDHQAGHGTFISGVVSQVCPDAVVHHRGVLTSYGDGDDASIGEGIRRAVDEIEEIDVAVMAFGTYGIEDRAPALRAEVELLQQRGVLVVASAGNDATTRPFYPAALPGVVAVGGLDGDRRAAFTNMGGWVDACAPATDVVSTFFTDFDERCGCCGRPVDEYRGWARWSGTSFAAPKVAGAVAQEMYLHDVGPLAAWARLRARATFRVPDLGIVVNC